MALKEINQNVESIFELIREKNRLETKTEKKFYIKESFKAQKLRYVNKRIDILTNKISTLVDSLFESSKDKAVLKLIEFKENHSITNETNLKTFQKQLSLINFDENTIFTKPDKIPLAIRDNINADFEEMEKCFKNGLYRSAIILCARILEVCLHRKYYDVTGHDVLEKSPGIGLGNLIGKMKDQGIDMDPAIAQQIHLLNQTRIYSVHKKEKAFIPNKNQAHAIILYTVEIVKGLFTK